MQNGGKALKNNALTLPTVLNMQKEFIAKTDWNVWGNYECLFPCWETMGAGRDGGTTVFSSWFIIPLAITKQIFILHHFPGKLESQDEKNRLVDKQWQNTAHNYEFLTLSYFALDAESEKKRCIWENWSWLESRTMSLAWKRQTKWNPQRRMSEISASQLDFKIPHDKPTCCPLNKHLVATVFLMWGPFVNVTFNISYR